MQELKEDYCVEEYLSMIEKIIDSLDENKGTLEDAVSLYEDGVKMINDCKKALSKAEARVKIINEQNGIEDIENL